MFYPKPITDLIEQFQKLPGIGNKSAERLAFHVVTKMTPEQANQFAVTLQNVKQNLHNCTICGHITDVDPCSICTDTSRDETVLCLVEDSKDVIAMEKMREFRGRYHVLHGTISPLDGIGPEDLNLRSLIERLKTHEAITEVILATNPTMEGEATAQYIRRLLEGANITVSRIAHGLPVGGDLEYVDEVTLLKALEGRRKM
ncbi:MAG: recombination mediator RecR [Culicoidibacterales bacterium]